MATISYSKLGGEYPMEFIKENDQKFHEQLKELRQKKSNKICADCGKLPTTWSSVNIGIFLCEECAQIHRGIGTHISKVKSCMGSYLWHPDEILNLKNIGNKKANKKYNSNYVKPTSDTDYNIKRDYIIDKYSNKV